MVMSRFSRTVVFSEGGGGAVGCWVLPPQASRSDIAARAMGIRIVFICDFKGLRFKARDIFLLLGFYGFQFSDGVLQKGLVLVHIVEIDIDLVHIILCNIWIVAALEIHRKGDDVLFGLQPF